MAQQQADATLRHMGLTKIRRLHFTDYGEVMIVLSAALDAVARDGALQRMHQDASTIRSLAAIARGAHSMCTRFNVRER